MPTFQPAPVGSVFERLTITGDGPRQFCGARTWTWICSCGEKGCSQMCAIKQGVTKSCGCYNRSMGKARRKEDARDRNPVYGVWCSMRERCRLKTVKSYRHYGGRGIKVCDRWNDFDLFVADMGPRPKGGTIERIDVNGNYDPSNCRWATHKEQMNNARFNVFLDLFGERITIAQASDKYGVPYHRLYGRIRKGWPAEKAVTLAYHQRHLLH